MNIIKPYARIIIPDYPMAGIDLLRRIEQIARVSHRSEAAQTEDSWRRFLTAVVLEHGDWSVTEHINVTVEAYVDRGITHEWVRHRLGAYTQESTRFVNYEKKMPPAFIAPELEDEPERAGNGEQVALSPYQLWAHAVDTCERSYRRMIQLGVAPQTARSVFPNALASKLIVTYNLRSWRHFFLMRTSKEAHPQMREVTIPLLAEFKTMIPLLYDDIEPNQRQIENMRKAR